MRQMTLEEIRAAVGGRWVRRGAAEAVGGVSTDTRTARAGDLFIALRGRRLDAHQFLAAAAAAGCRAAIVALGAALPGDAAAAFPGGVIAVPDTTAALGDLAARHRRLCRAAVVGVTGSNGKTTVKRMIHHILRRRLRGSCSPRSFNNQIGVPLTLLGVEPGDDYVICEIGTNAPGEVAALARLARPDLAVITSIAGVHQEKLGTIEQVAREKASILEYLPTDGLAVVWAHSEHLDRAIRACSGRIRLVRFGLGEPADLRLTGYRPMGPRQRFQLNGRLWAELPLPGRHNALNALAAIAAAGRFGFAPDQAAVALADFVGEPMRLEWTELPAGTIINDAYNANPASLAAAVDVLAECRPSAWPGPARRVLVVGDMLELGDQAEALHAQAGRDLAGKGIGLVITVGALARHIARGAAEVGLDTAEFDSLSEAAGRLADLLRPGDAVLLKGSRASAMESLMGPIRQVLAGPSPECHAAARKGLDS